MCALCVAPLALSAATLTVTTNEDDGDDTSPIPGSLRAAMNDAADGDTIVFALEGAGTEIQLEDSLPDFTGVLTIDGTGATGINVVAPDADDLTFTFLDGDVTFIDVSHEDGMIDMDGTLTFETSLDTTIDVEPDIADVDTVALDVGSLVKTGEGTLVLTGTNTYTGGTTIEAGTVEGDTDALRGLITNDAALVFDQSTDGTFVGTISGTGTVEKDDSGTLTFDTPHDWSGGLTVTEGTLSITDTGSIDYTQPITIEADGTLDLDIGGVDRTLSDLRSSEGAITKGGTATLTLDSGRLTGLLTIDDGVVEDQANVVQGDVSMLAGTLRLAGFGSMPGDIVLGTVEKTGTGTVTLTGNNQHTNTEVIGGVLVVDSNSISTGFSILPNATTIHPGAVLRIDQSFDGVYTGFLRDGCAGTPCSATIEKTGAGRFTMLSNQFSAVYRGRVDVLAGTLELGTGVRLGESSAQMEIHPTGAFSGSGEFGGSVDAHGLVAPSTPLTPLTVGAITFMTGSALEIDVTSGSGGTAEQLVVSGVADVAGATVRVVPASGDYLNDPVLGKTILSAASIVGTPTISQDFPFLTITPTLSATALDIDVQFTSAGFTSGSTPNRLAVGGALEEAFAMGSPPADMVDLFDNLTALSTPQLEAAYDSLSGETVSAFTTARLAIADRFGRSLRRRVRDLDWGRGEAFFQIAESAREEAPKPRFATAAGAFPLRGVAAAPTLPLEPAPGVGGWLDGWGVIGEVEGDGNAGDVDLGLAGTTLGFDYRLGEHGLVGAAAGYGHVDLDVSGRPSESESHAALAAVYAGWVTPKAHASFTGRFAWSRNESERKVDFGAYRGRAEGDFDGIDYGVGFEVGANALRIAGASVQPLAGFDWIHIDSDGFTEKGALGANLDIEGESIDSLRTSVGLDVHGRLLLEEGAEMVPRLRLRWLHEFGDRERIVRARFVSAASGGSFRVRGAESPRDAFLAGLGWSAALGRNVHVLGDYDAVIDSDRLQHELALTLRVRF